MRTLGGNEHPNEHIADGIIHLLGVVGSLIAVASLFFYADASLADISIPPLIIYCIGLIATFVFSAAYNMTKHPGVKAVFQRLDHSAIFIMIAGTYTPLALIGIGGGWGDFLAISVWVIAAVGVFIKLFFCEQTGRISLLLYLGQGWLAVIAIKPMYESLSLYSLTLIALGGLIYTLGVIFYRRDDWRYNRAIWHSFVLIAASIHYAAVLDIAKLV
jgi:hemolysin III